MSPPLAIHTLSRQVVDAEITRIQEEVVGVVFAHDREASVSRHSDRHHGLIDDVGDLLVRSLPLRKPIQTSGIMSAPFARTG